MSNPKQSELTEINVYPIKSVSGIAMSSGWVEKQGLCFDRRFMLAFADGAMVTARKFPHMVNVKSSLIPDGLVLSYQDKPSLVLRYKEFLMEEVKTQVWNDRFVAYSTVLAANKWFSEVVGRPVQLLFSGEQSNRIRDKVGHNVSFADGYPLLVISQPSLDELNRRSSEQHLMDQFRTNLVVSGTEAFVEDSWKRIRIGEVEFEAVKPCERCILTTVDTTTGHLRANKEPLNTLGKFRANEKGGVFFGQNLVAKNEGMIRVGDAIEVLEVKDKEIYHDEEATLAQLTCVGKREISPNFVAFTLERSEGILSPFKAGQYLPIELNIDNKKHTRNYTLSSHPSELKQYEICVKRVEDGQVSNWLLDHFKVGDGLLAKAPSGDFCLTNADEPLLLAAAGSGVTPMLSILRYLEQIDKLSDVVFYYQCKTLDDVPCKSELQRLEARHPGLKLHIALSQPAGEWNGLKGRVCLSHFKSLSELTHRQVFVCGPDGFMKKTENLLMKMGLPQSHYHQEAFGVAAFDTGIEKSVSISINGAQFIGNNKASILEQAEDAGIFIANSCRAGLCGACKITMAEGDYLQPDVPALLPDDKVNRQALACCCIPQSDVVIES